VIYLDTAAIVKLVRRERSSEELTAWLDERTDRPLVASALVEVEVPRALRRSAPQALVGVPAILTRIHRLEINATVRQTAAAFEIPHLRSLDAIHLATAYLLAARAPADPLVFVTYDDRLLDSARETGLAIAAPGHRPDGTG
jgi:predicted nucleic acid-binding protein